MVHMLHVAVLQPCQAVAADELKDFGTAQRLLNVRESLLRVLEDEIRK